MLKIPSCSLHDRWSALHISSCSSVPGLRALYTGHIEWPVWKPWLPVFSTNLGKTFSINVTSISLAIVPYPIIIQYPNAAHIPLSLKPIRYPQYPIVYPCTWVFSQIKVATDTWWLTDFFVWVVIAQYLGYSSAVRQRNCLWRLIMKLKVCSVDHNCCPRTETKRGTESYFVEWTHLEYWQTVSGNKQRYFSWLLRYPLDEHEYHGFSTKAWRYELPWYVCEIAHCQQDWYTLAIAWVYQSCWQWHISHMHVKFKY